MSLVVSKTVAINFSEGMELDFQGHGHRSPSIIVVTARGGALRKNLAKCLG
jgi:hypothetical protein